MFSLVHRSEKALVKVTTSLLLSVFQFRDLHHKSTQASTSTALHKQKKQKTNAQHFVNDSWESKLLHFSPFCSCTHVGFLEVGPVNWLEKYRNEGRMEKKTRQNMNGDSPGWRGSNVVPCQSSQMFIFIVTDRSAAQTLDTWASFKWLLVFKSSSSCEQGI